MFELSMILLLVLLVMYSTVLHVCYFITLIWRHCRYWPENCEEQGLAIGDRHGWLVAILEPSGTGRIAREPCACNTFLALDTLLLVDEAGQLVCQVALAWLLVFPLDSPTASSNPQPQANWKLIYSVSPHWL